MASKVFRKLQVHTISTAFRQATKVVEVPLVKPPADLVRIKNIYAGVNATDMNYTAGRIPSSGKVPFDIGIEGLGIIDAIGSNVPSGSFKVGQPVLVVDSVHNMFSEYLYKKPVSLLPVPELKANYLVANINGLTGSLSLDKAGRIESGETVLVTAAAGGTGQVAVQWAKHKGCTVIATTSSEEKAKYLHEIGVDLVINYKEESIEQVLKEKFPEGIDVIWETIGGETFKVLLGNLALRGRIVVLGSTTTYQGEGFGDVPISNLNGKLKGKSQSINGFSVFHYGKYYSQYLPKLIKMIGDGVLKAKVDLGQDTPEGLFRGIEQTARAEEWLHLGKNLGKVVVQLQEA